jgi:hypothetical protein
VPRRSDDLAPKTPEELYDGLTVTDPAIGGLWRRQSHILGLYYENHRDSDDVALELPTGAGKTLVGLLIADWRRRVTGGSSAFVCPTRQLARQAYEKAEGYGIPAVLLTGSNTGWTPGDVTRGVTGEATIISVYSHIFNISPKLKPQTLVLDDAHAAEGPVAKNWSVVVNRQHEAYEPLLDAVASAIPGERLSELRNEDLAPHLRPAPQMIGPKDLGDRAEAVIATLDEHLDWEESASYALSEIRGHLAGCIMYASWGELLIRPFVPPTRFHDAFEGADQRVYLSATLGQAGEIERSFGRKEVPRVETPLDWERHGTGRRLILLPRAGMHAGEASAFIQETIEEFERALVLVPSEWQAEEVRVLLPDGWTVLDKEDIDERLHPFQVSTECALVLANRYDGIDLPGDQCELILISGLPAGTHLQERFLFDTVEARSALRERIRTRLMQGVGRATRSRTDHAVVLMTGESLVEFLREPANLTGLRPELQAELGYGMYLAQEDHELADVIASFIAKDENWSQAEEYLREEADRAGIEAPAGTQQLQESASWEVLACQAAWRGEPQQACAHAVAAVRRLTVGAVGPYRTLWKVLAAHWAAQHAAESEDALDARIAAELVRDAAASARTRAWRPVLPDVPVSADAEALDTRAMRLAGELQAVARSPRADRRVDELESWIGSDAAPEFERGLERMGTMLGFDAIRPNVPAAPDGAWRDGNDQILWEAKSEQEDDGCLSAQIVRQATTHPTWVENELDWEHAQNQVVFLASPRQSVDRSGLAVAADHLYLTSIESVRSLGAETAALWRSLVAGINGLTPSEAAERISEEIAAQGLTTKNLKARLDAVRIADLDPQAGDD